MALRARYWGRTVWGWSAAFLLAAGLGGCGGKVEPAKPDQPGASAPGSKGGPPATPANARLNQPFNEATLSEPSPNEEPILPDVTMTGKSVGKLYVQVVSALDKVTLIDAAGKHEDYVALLDTEMGEIEIHLLSELAPNHVRNFLALAKVGYYDGLVFERIIRQKADNDPTNVLEMVEGGCPCGTGNPGFGSIGYWLKAEFSEQVKHEEGTVCACLGQEADTAACRFYITLSKAPALDGERTIFGKVTRGLDIVRRIASQEILNSAEFPDGTHPKDPIMIRKVTIQTKEAAPSSTTPKS